MKKIIAAALLLSSLTVQGSELKEVVITAQRKAENLQTVPMSVSVIKQSDFETRQIEVVDNVLSNAPNIIGNNNLGQSTALSIFIRGVGTTENLATADTAVGVYVDGVYVGRQSFNNLSLYDMESVEVIRGPQGVLYGRNTNGGAVKITRAKPSGQDFGLFTYGYGSYGHNEVKILGNSRLTDHLAVRGNFVVAQNDGYMTALDKDVNNLDYIGGVGSLRGEWDNLDATITVDYSSDKTNGNFVVDIAGIVQPRSGDLLKSNSLFDAKNNSETYGATLNIKTSVGSSSVESISGFRSTKQLFNFDASGLSNSLYTSYQLQYAEQVSQEFQFSGPLSDQLSYLGGLYYFNEKANVDLADLVRQPPSFSLTALYKDFDVEVSNYAVYGQVEYKLNKFTFGVGARYTEEDRSLLNFVQTSNVPVAIFNYNAATLVARKQAGQNIDLNRHFNKTTPRYTVSYSIDSNATAYVSLTEGFRTGGWTGRALRVDQYINFDPENVKTLEAGIRLNGDNWRWNTTVSETDYTNLFNTLTVNGAFTVQTADASIKAVESEGEFAPTSWLNVHASLGLLDGEYKQPKPANLESKLQRSPELQGKVGAVVTLPVKSGQVVLAGDVYYVSEYLLTPANLAFTAPSLANKNLEVSGKYAIVNASLSYKVGDGSLTLQCSNCLNRQYVEGAAYIGAFAGAWANNPRMVKLSITERF